MSQDFLAVATPSVARIPLHEPRTLHTGAPYSTYTVIHEEVPPSSAALTGNNSQSYLAPASPAWRLERGAQSSMRGGSPGRDALGRPVYLPPTSPGGVVTESFLRYTDPVNHYDNHAADAYSTAETVGRPSGGARSTTHAELVQLDREVAALKEELASRTQECSMLKSALQREHEAALRLNATHAKAIESIRTEHDRQTLHLSEQLAVMKGVAEGASADRKRLADDAAQRKAQLMNLLERERDEKSRIMAEYRQQTETLIAEQAAEISGLRELLDAAKAEEERFLQLQHRYEEQRADSEHNLMRLESALNDERLASQRAIREVEHRHQAEMDEMRRQTERRQHEIEQQMLKLQLEVERREDAVRTAQDRVGAADHRHETERAEMKGHYEGCIEALTHELTALKSAREVAEVSLRAEMEEAGKNHSQVVASLRSDLEAARRERMEEREASRAAREDAVRQSQARIRELESQLDEARADVLEERALRKDAEATRQSLTIKTETQQTTIARLNTELERLTVDTRTRERQSEQQHMAVEDSLRAQVRQLESEASRAKQNVSRLETELERVVGKRNATTQALEDEVKTLRRDLEETRAASLAATSEKQDSEVKRSKLLDTLLAGKVKLESENHALAAQVAELEARYATAMRQLGEERDALDRAVADAHRAKELVEDLRCSLDNERARLADAITRAEKAELLLPPLEEDIAATRGRVMELEKKQREAESALLQERSSREAERGGAKAQLEARVAQLQEEVAAAANRLAEQREARVQLEEQLRTAREEATKWQREAMSAEARAEDRLRSTALDASEEARRMESILASVREECTRAQAARSAALRDAAESAHDADRRIALMQEALDAERASKHRLHDELRSKEQAAAEAQGTMRLLSARIQSKEDEVRRLEEELHDATTRIHEAHTIIGKKEAMVGQLSAKLKVLESHASSNGAAHRGASAASASSSSFQHNQYLHQTSHGGVGGDGSGVPVRIHTRSRSETSFTS